MLMSILTAGAFAVSTAAQVTGNLKLDAWVWPQTTSFETTVLDIGLEAWLDLEIKLSGLSFSNRVAFGIAGIEHYIASLETTLGPVELNDQFAFAVPYIDCPGYRPWIFRTIDFFSALKGFESCKPIGELLFVGKRIKADIALGGLEFAALAMLEDVNFPSPMAKATDGLPTDPLQTYGDDYRVQDQEFRFGGILELSGTTVSGIRITAKTGICADWDITIFTGFWGRYFNMKGLEWGPAKYIKKHVWYEEVCLNPRLEFTKEYLAVEGISPIEGFIINSYLLFKPDLSEGIVGYLNFDLSLLNIGRLNGFLRFTGPKAVQLEPAYWGISGLGSPFLEFHLGGLTLIWEDVDADLAVDGADMITTSLVIPIQGVQSLFMAQFVPTVGMVRLLMVAGFLFSPASSGDMFEIAALWERGSPPTWAGELECTTINFRLKRDPEEGPELGLDVIFEAPGLSTINAWAKVEFSHGI